MYVKQHYSHVQWCTSVAHSEHRFPAPSKDVVNQCLEFASVGHHKWAGCPAQHGRAACAVTRVPRFSIVNLNFCLFLSLRFVVVVISRDLLLFSLLLVPFFLCNDVIAGSDISNFFPFVVCLCVLTARLSLNKGSNMKMCT